MYIIAVIAGLAGGVVHQLHDSEETNEKSNIVRSAVMGAIAGILTVAIYPITDTNALIISTFVAGWFGDSVVLNIIRRYNNTGN